MGYNFNDGGGFNRQDMDNALDRQRFMTNIRNGSFGSGGGNPVAGVIVLIIIGIGLLVLFNS